jgi:hypothetical protein
VRPLNARGEPLRMASNRPHFPFVLHKRLRNGLTDSAVCAN